MVFDFKASTPRTLFCDPVPFAAKEPEPTALLFAPDVLALKVSFPTDVL